MLAAVVWVNALPLSVWEQGTALSVYKFERDDPTGALTVNFSVGGSATYGSDYSQTGATTFTTTTGTVTFADESTTAELTIDATPDAVAEPSDETVVLTVTAGTGYDVGEPAAAAMTIYETQQTQIVTPIDSSSDSTLSVDPGGAIVFDANYTTSNVDNHLTGLGLRIHYDSTKVTRDFISTETVKNGLTNVLTTSLASNTLYTLDTNNYDNDASTDRYIAIAWADYQNGVWPGTTLPQRLFTAKFHAVTGSAAVGTTQFNFSYSSLAAGDYGFSPTSYTVTYNVVGATADAGGPYSVVEGGSVGLDASLTTHPTQDAATLTYEWDFDSDGSYDDATGITPTFSAASLDGPSAVTVGLRVTDANSISVTDTATVNVTNVVPTVAISDATDGFNGVRGQTRTFNLTALDASVVDMAGSFVYSITWGDGATENVPGPASTTASHVYTATGTYTPSVIVTDEDGGASASASGVAQTIGVYERQGTSIALGGTTDADTFAIAQVTRAGRFSLVLNGTSYGTQSLGGGGKLLLFAQDGTDAITVGGSTSTDKFQLSSTGVVLNGATVAASGMETWTLAGLAGTDTFVAPDSANTWALGAADAGTVGSVAFTGMEKLVGGASTDDFTISSTTKTYALIDGGAGGGRIDYSAYGRAVSLNMGTSTGPGVSRYQNITGFIGNEETATSSTIRGGNGTNAWVLSGANSGTLNGATFEKFKNLIGGRGADTFTVQESGSITGTVDGGTGCDVLDYSAFTSAVTVDLSSNAADGLGAVRNFRMVIGGSAGDTLTGGSAAAVLIGGAGDDVLQGGAGRDILVGGLGADTLRGGGGDDILFGGNALIDTRTADSILQLWNRPISYVARLTQLSGIVSDDVLVDDAAVDQLYGEGGQDWFVTYTGDVVNDQDVMTELITELD